MKKKIKEIVWKYFFHCVIFHHYHLYLQFNGKTVNETLAGFALHQIWHTPHFYLYMYFQFNGKNVNEHIVLHLLVFLFWCALECWGDSFRELSRLKKFSMKCGNHDLIMPCFSPYCVTRQNYYAMFYTMLCYYYTVFHTMPLLFQLKDGIVIMTVFMFFIVWWFFIV